MGMTWDGRALTAAETEALRADPDRIWGLVDGPPPGSVDLDKAWHGIHWLLTGDPWGGPGPLGQVIFGGEGFGPDEGYGPPRLLDPAGVAAVAAALTGIRREDLRSRFDPAAMSAAELYPDIWADPEVFDEYLGPNFDKLKAMYHHAAARDQWVLQWLH
ncbi:YfbM family protein [Microlunatus speluncae]|uniref:YfbM family protein n=1 Tax=Microlunatus speluncae TaxID=2594267 RepID=UPI0012666D30|nr:YfbM family protein [Microlunatus speluncae]